jgi:hypothetical protein
VVETTLEQILNEGERPLIKGNPLFGNVARDSRYAAFLRKMKLPE